MGFLDKAKETASHLAEQAKGKIDEVKEKRKVDDLLGDLGRVLYRQRTDRGEPGDEAVIVGLVDELRKMEADGTEVLAAAPVVDPTPSTDSSTAPSTEPATAGDPLPPPSPG